jgi:ParB-like chromosome segregation protein Spo0J
MKQRKYEKHELADLFPPMSDQERRELRQSLKQNGLIDSIVLFERKILEGWHRYTECLALGIEPVFVSFQTMGEYIYGMHPVDYVWAKNFSRRHLNPSTRAALAIKREQLRKKQYITYADMKENYRKREHEAETKAVQVVKRLANSPVGNSFTEKTRQQMAAEAGVTSSTITQAVAIAERAPKKFEQVLAGKVSLNEAFERLPLTKKQKERRAKRLKDFALGFTTKSRIQALIARADDNGGKLYVEVGGYGIQLRKGWACHVEQDALDRLSGK